MSSDGTSCEQIIEQHGDMLREYGTPGEVFNASNLQVAFQDWQDGVISGSDLSQLQTAFNQGCRVPRADTPPADDSAVDLSIEAVRSPSPATIIADVVVTNTITSGDGVSLSPTVEAVVNGGVQSASRDVTIPPGGSATIEFMFTDTPTGPDVEVCASAV